MTTKKRTPRAVGRSSGLPLQQYIRSLFEENEGRGPKRVDDQILVCVREEFQDCPTVIEPLLQANRNVVAVWRSQYNRGRLAAGTPGKPSHNPPTRVSFCYNHKGERIHPQTKRPLTPEQQKETAVRVGLKDARFS